MRSYRSESEVEAEVRSRSFTFVHDLFGQFMVWSLRTRVGIGNWSLRTQDRLWFWCGCGSGRSLNSQLRRLMIFVISSVSSTSATRVVSGWRIYRSERSHSDSYPLIHVSRSVLCSPKNLLSTVTLFLHSRSHCFCTFLAKKRPSFLILPVLLMLLNSQNNE